MERNAWYPGLVSAVRTVACWCSAFWIFTMTEHGRPLGLDAIAYLAFAVVSFAFFALFLRKPRALPLLVAVGALFWGVGAVVLLWKFSTLVTFLSKVFAVLAVLTVVVFNIRNCMETPPAKAANIEPMNAKDEPRNTGLLNFVKS